MADVLLAHRTTLAAAIRSFGDPSCPHRLYGPCADCLTEHLFASGAVRDAVSLPDDEAFVEQVARIWVARNHPRRAYRFGDRFPATGWIRALAAALAPTEEKA